LLAAFMADRFGIVIGFAEWMALGVPLATLLLIAAWLLLTRVIYRLDKAPVAGAAEAIAAALAELGPMRRQEKLVAAVLGVVALLWILRPFLSSLAPGLHLSDPAIAVLGGLCLFAMPEDLSVASLKQRRFLMDWETAKTLPFDVLILFGGGLSLASAIQVSGLAEAIGDVIGHCVGWPFFAIAALIATLVVFLTELTSNTATASVFIPIAAGLGASLDAGPVLFALPAALAATCAFMMPVATPPNAIVYASHQVTIPQMARSGLALNLVCIVAIPLATYLIAGWWAPK
jgi:sodium-dependent dicarboxylate transporter 2/3/5